MKEFVFIGKYPSMSVSTDNQFDYIVVGGGTAGATIIDQLIKPSKKGGCFKVLLLERGGDLIGEPIVYDPRLALVADNHPATTTFYPSVREAGLGGEIVLFSQGLGDGGSSSNNYAFTGYVSDAWLGNLETLTGLSGAKFREAQKSLETYVPQPGGALDDRGTDGPFTISQLPVGSTIPGFPTTAQTAGINDQVATTGLAYQLGVAFGAAERIPPNDDYNASVPALPNGIFVRGQYAMRQDGTNWIRSGPGMEFLNKRRIKKVKPGFYQSKCKGDLIVVNFANVNQILFDEGCHGKKKRIRAVGVSFTVGGTCTQAFATCGVILAGGVVDSPRLLQLSGIGNKTDLCAASIKPKVNLPAVGYNLRFQTNWSLELRSASQAYAQFPSILGLVNLATTPLSPPYAATFVPVRTVEFLVTPSASSLITPYGVEVQGTNLIVRSSGTVAAVNPNPLTLPKIDFDPMADANDRALFIAAVRAVAAAVTAVNTVAPGTLIYAGTGFDPSTASDDEIVAHIASTATFSNGVGTCSIGDDCDTSVVSKNFKVHKVKGLWVCDNSVVPVVPDNRGAPLAWTLGYELGKSLRCKGKCC